MQIWRRKSFRYLRKKNLQKFCQAPGIANIEQVVVPMA